MNSIQTTKPAFGGKHLLTMLRGLGVELLCKPRSRTEWEWVSKDATQCYWTLAKQFAGSDSMIELNSAWNRIKRMLSKKTNPQGFVRGQISLSRLNRLDMQAIASSSSSLSEVARKCGMSGALNAQRRNILRRYLLERFPGSRALSETSCPRTRRKKLLLAHADA